MPQLVEGNYYHLYNRGINKGRLFFSGAHYDRFIEKLHFYTYSGLEIWAWCLMSNHFHLLARVRSIEEQKELFLQLKKRGNKDEWFVLKSPRFKFVPAFRLLSHWMNSHTRFVNQLSGRSGALFEGRFKRIEVSGEDYLRYLICYIHRNPIHHGISDTFSSYPYSSYRELTTDVSTFLARDKILNCFGGSQNFIAAHEEVKESIEEYHLE